MGRDSEIYELPAGSSLHDLYGRLQQSTPRLRDFRNSVVLSVNYEYSNGSVELHDNDEVAFIPPVSGGIPEGAISAGHEPLMSEHACLVRLPIETAKITETIKRPEDGALVVFDGIVRNNTRGRATLYLDYTAYEPMALRQMEQLAQRALADFKVRDVRLAHRVGRLEIGESSVLIAVASAHRAAAFDACCWLIDTLKKEVPIWKKEYFEDGAVWDDGESFPDTVPRLGEGNASK
jgi:molybdopterin synthase catalytic subunit